jgi:hypothetical protein
MGSKGIEAIKNHRRPLMRVLMFFVLLLHAGCGYSTGSLLPANIKTIAVEPISNEIDFSAEGRRASYIPLLETKVRDALLKRFAFDGRLRVEDSEVSDLTIMAKLIGFEREELRLSEGQDVMEYRIRITLNIQLVNNTTNEVDWQEPSFSGESTYFLTGPQAKSEQQALEEALTDLSRRIVERTIENW